MTRLSRTAWWAILVVATGGLLLSFVMLVRTPPPPPPVQEVTGSAALAAGPDRESGARAEPAVMAGRERHKARSTTPERQKVRAAPRVARSSASVPKAPRRVNPPTRVRVPSVGLNAAVAPVGVGADSQMRLPINPGVLGWYRYGSAPGSGSGSPVLAGHVDSRRFGIGPLARLGEVGRGDVVEVRVGRGRWASYRVDSVQRFDQQALPAAVFARGGPERLRLVTCTGPFLPAKGGYQQNLVVTAVPTRR